MLPAGHRHPVGKAVEVVMGSMSCVPSIGWVTITSAVSFASGYEMGCCFD